MRAIVLLFLVLTAALTLHAQKLPFGERHWGMSEGLPQHSVTSLLQTRDGYLWMGTAAGLARFDGLRFKVFDRALSPSLISEYVQSLAEDTSGKLWVGTIGGGLYSLSADGFQPAPDPDKKLGRLIYALCADRSGRLWIGSERGLFRFENGVVSAVRRDDGFPSRPVFSIAEANDASIWFAAFGEGLGRSRPERIDRWTRKEGLVDDRLVHVSQQADGNLYLGTFNGGLQQMRAGRLQAPMVQPLRDRSNSNRGIWAVALPRGPLAELSPAPLWVGSFARGLGFAGPAGLQFPKPAPPSGVVALLEDREGNLWVGSEEGLTQYRRLPIRTFGAEDGLPSRVAQSVWSDSDGELWTGTAAGLARVRYSASGLRSQLVTPMEVLARAADRQGNQWLGTSNKGLFLLPKNATKPIPAHGPWKTNAIIALAVDAMNTLWVGTARSGLFRCTGTDAQLACGKVEAVQSGSINNLLAGARGYLWVASSKGLYEHRDGEWRLYGKGSGLHSIRITALQEDDQGSLWIGSDGGGLARFAEGRFTVAHRGTGFPEDSIYAIQIDQAGNLWLGGLRGLFRLPRESFPGSAQHPPAYVSYGAFDGLSHVQLSSESANASAQTPDAALWFASSRGLARILPTQETKASDVPAARIEESTVDGETIHHPGQILVPAGARRLEVRLTALSLSTPEKRQLRYRLDGFDEDWQEAASRRIAAYTSLPPGNYLLRLSAMSADGRWSDQEARMPVNVLPLYYQTLWFRALCLLSLTAITSTFFFLRMKRLRRELGLVMAERNRIASEIHDTYLQGFTGITMQLGALRYKVSTPQRAALDDLLLQADACLADARSSIWNMRNPGDAARSLADAVSDLSHTIQQQFGATIECKLEPCQLPASSPEGQTLLRILREALTNACHHSSATVIQVRLWTEQQALRLEVMDDGCGFVPAMEATPGHFGLLGMRERAQRLGGWMEVESAPGEGTRVEALIPQR
jgi:ligand-binding sensor domain-containing protein